MLDDEAADEILELKQFWPAIKLTCVDRQHVESERTSDSSSAHVMSAQSHRQPIITQLDRC